MAKTKGKQTGANLEPRDLRPSVDADVRKSDDMVDIRPAPSKATKSGDDAWLVWDAENSTLQSVHSSKDAAERHVEKLLRAPGHDADKLAVVKAPNRHSSHWNK